MLARFTKEILDGHLAWRNVLGVALLAGIGLTVSLLIGELGFDYGTVTGADAKIESSLDRWWQGPWRPSSWSAPTPTIAAFTNETPPTPTGTACRTCTSLDGPNHVAVRKLS